MASYCLCGCGTEVNRKYAVGHWIRLNNPMKDPKIREKVGSTLRGRKQPKWVIEKRVKAIRGYNHTEETKQRLRVASLKQFKNGMPEDTKEKMRGPRVSLQGENNPSKRDDVRQKLREIRTEQIINSNSTANYNKYACKVFKKLNKDLNLNGVHAKNGGEKIVKGFWLDYYEPNLNLVIEWDEPFHYENGKLRNNDIKRQKIIEKELGCDFIRIKQEEFNYNILLEKINARSNLAR
jgi:very-short-patch-repair endonuclease|tara:strand:- start:11 stop:718 length:708 start_codon:yes stop_codon:yes gene_type:complete